MPLIAIEGLDGAGKATQADLLYRALSARRIPSQVVSLPDYDSDSSALVRMYLSGLFGDSPYSVNAYAASSFFAVDRYASYCLNWGEKYRNGQIIIADRYTSSNAIHQCAKLSRPEWIPFLNWLYHYEYDLLGIPPADITLYLRVSDSVRESMLDKRYRGNRGSRDLHESDGGYQSRCAAAADFCCSFLKWIPIDCDSGGKMRDVYNISREIVAALEERGVLCATAPILRIAESTL